MNSRPLVRVDSLPTDGSPVLTPGHQIIGRPICAIPTTVDRRHRHQASQEMELDPTAARGHLDEMEQDLPARIAEERPNGEQHNPTCRLEI